LIIDALDEYSKEDMAWIPLLDQIRKLSPHLNFLVTARPIASIEREFPDALRVQITAQEIDILAYVRSGLDHQVFQKHIATDDIFRSYVEEALVAKSHGM
jgi:hypothetical protein